MHEVAVEPREQLLRWIAEAAPAAWFPRNFLQTHRVPKEVLDQLLEELWLEGLIEKATRSPEAGPGVALTDRGRQVLDDPQLLTRLRNGLPLAEGDQGAVVRGALRARVRPVLTRALLFANVAVFGLGAYLAWRWQPPVLNAYLSGAGNDVVLGILKQCGGVSREEIVAGQWWRLLTCAFVHGGLMHLLFNMLALYVLGPQTETMWGRGRFLVLYLVSAWVCSCVAIAYTSAPVFVGASGAICGLLAADVCWILLNRRYLPRALRRRAYSNTIINLVLLGLISMAPGVSGWGHFGGLAAGAAASVLLHLQRFGPRILRWPALAAVAVVPLTGLLLLQQAETTDPTWLQLRDKYFLDTTLTHTRAELRRANSFYNQDVEPLLDLHATRRDSRAAGDIRPRLTQWQRNLEQVAHNLEAAGVRHDEVLETARRAAHDYASAIAELFGLADRCLAAGADWTAAQERQLRQQTQRVEDLRAAWLDLLSD